MKYKDIADKYFVIQKELRKACYSDICEMMLNKQLVEFSRNELEKRNLDPITVSTEDGYEIVRGIRPNGYGDDFVIETENGDVFLSHLPADEQFDVCEMLYDFLNTDVLTDENKA